MNNSYKQILEAIDKGIQFALDDFDYNDTLNIKAKDNVINKEDSLWKSIKFKDYFVDLGLPSGTLWCKYNLGCDFDLLNEHPENANAHDWYGDYYAWGALTPNPNGKLYLWQNYKFCKGKYNSLTKYCNSENYGYDMELETDDFLSYYTDDLDQLLPEDDIVTQLYGKKYHIPTKEQWEELIDNTILDYGYQNENYHFGFFILTSKINGNKLYIPKSGYNNNLGLSGQGIYACLWSSTLNELTPNNAFRQGFSKHTPEDKPYQNMAYDERCKGFTIRPVYG